MNVYQTDDLGFLIGVTQADPDPLNEGQWLLPGGCVNEVPPPAGDMQIARWTSSGWVLVADNRGQTYWTADGARHVILQPGIDFPAGALSTDPGPTAEQVADRRRADIKEQLVSLDVKKIRAITDALLDGDTTRLAALELQAQALRNELAQI